MAPTDSIDTEQIIELVIRNLTALTDAQLDHLVFAASMELEDRDFKGTYTEDDEDNFN